jgi:hypothetical protein
LESSLEVEFAAIHNVFFNDVCVLSLVWVGVVKLVLVQNEIKDVIGNRSLVAVPVNHMSKTISKYFLFLVVLNRQAL